MPTVLTRNRLLLHKPIGAYLINDDFSFNLPVNSVAGTLAYPGPGVRAVTDTESKLSIASGAVAFSPRTTPTNGDPGVWLSMFSRQAGRLMVAQVTSNNNTKALDIGLDSNQLGLLSGPALLFRGTGAITERVLGTPGPALRDYAANTAYPVAIVLRTTGHLFFVKISSNWLLLWVSATGAQDPVYPAFMNFDATATCDYIRVPNALWLPAPLASDGFGSSFGTTDGLGHAEGVAAGIGSGGNGVSWTQSTGTWATSAGAAASTALSGGIAVATVNTSKADVIVTAKVTRSAGNAGVVVRYADTSNFVYAIHNGTNAQLIKVVAGTPTTLVNAAATYSAGAEIRVTAEGQKFRLYYNNALIGTEQTIADAGLASGTRQGLYTSSTSNSFDDFTVYSRGSGGEYAALDNY